MKDDWAKKAAKRAARLAQETSQAFWNPFKGGRNVAKLEISNEEKRTKRFRNCLKRTAKSCIFIKADTAQDRKKTLGIFRLTA